MQFLLFLGSLKLIQIAYSQNTTIDQQQCTLPTCNELANFLPLNSSLAAGDSISQCLFTCLAAGKSYQMYRSASAVVMIMNQSMPNQFEIFCNLSSMWEMVSLSLRNVSPDALSLPTREDCFSCNRTYNNYACVDCPTNCKGSGHCLSSTECCPFYNIDGNCTNQCPEGTTLIASNYTCKPTPGATMCEKEQSLIGILVGIGVTIIVLLVLGMVILGIVVVILYHKLKEQTELVNDCIEIGRIKIPQTKEFSPPIQSDNSTTETNYEPININTKQSIHLYSSSSDIKGKSKSLPAKIPSVDDEGYVDCKKEPEKPLGTYIDLDFDIQRTRKGASGSSVRLLKKARENAAWNVKQKASEADSYSYVHVEHRKLKDLPKLQEEGTHSVGSKESKESGYVDCFKPSPVIILKKGASVDADGYVDCIIIEDPKQKSNAKKDKEHSKKPNKANKPSFLLRKK